MNSGIINFVAIRLVNVPSFRGLCRIYHHFRTKGEAGSILAWSNMLNQFCNDP